MNSGTQVRILKSVFIFQTLSKQQLQRLANALQTLFVRLGERVFQQGDEGTCLRPDLHLPDPALGTVESPARHFYIIRKGLVLVEINGRKIRTSRTKAGASGGA